MKQKNKGKFYIILTRVMRLVECYYFCYYILFGSQKILTILLLIK